MSIRTGAAALVAAALAACSAPAGPAPAPSATGEPARSGPQLTAQPTQELAGRTTVRVQGTGYDEGKGIYVAFCVRPPAGEAPTPCGGGVNRSGEGSSSHWISSNPPPYGRKLATPYGAGGSFDVQLTVTPAIGEVDCRVHQCVIATRADHTRSTDRTADVFVPVTFQKEDR